MDVKQTITTLIPAIKAFCNAPIIQADQSGDKPDATHATFKVTSPYIKGVGQAEQTPIQLEASLQMKHVENYKIVYSFTAYDKDDEISLGLAQKIHDWFTFHGSQHLDQNGIVISDITAVQNRDAFVIDGYERRNGFDVTLRVTKEMSKDVDYFTTVKNITD